MKSIEAGHEAEFFGGGGCDVIARLRRRIPVASTSATAVFGGG